MAPKGKKFQVSVVGGSSADEKTLALAEAVGRTVASHGAILISGGLGGVMEAAARGAKEEGGLTIGILPDYKKESANPFIDIILPTGLGHARNLLVAAAGDLVVALPGSHGTRSEVDIALILGKRILGFKAWGEIQGVHQINTLKELENEMMPNL